jgi:hypothetical protein
MVPVKLELDIEDTLLAEARRVTGIHDVQELVTHAFVR